MTLRRTEDETSKKYWEQLNANSEDVARWPEWKKGHRRIEVVASQASTSTNVKPDEGQEEKG